MTPRPAGRPARANGPVRLATPRGLALAPHCTIIWFQTTFGW